MPEVYTFRTASWPSTLRPARCGKNAFLEKWPVVTVAYIGRGHEWLQPCYGSDWYLIAVIGTAGGPWCVNKQTMTMSDVWWMCVCVVCDDSIDE